MVRDRGAPGARPRKSRRVALTGFLLGFVAMALVLQPAAALAKKFRYSAGPKAPEDTVHAVAEQELQPIVRTRGPKVPATNLQVVGLVANTVFDRALETVPLER